MAAGRDYRTQAGAIAAMADECRIQGIGLPAQIAYVLATVEHETNGTFQPVREAYWLSEAWRRQHLRYFPFYGRGFVQLTWRANYAKYARLLRVDLVGHPDLAMKPDIACFILVDGFVSGAFTGKTLFDYVRADHTDFVGARRCINGTDKARHIAGLANVWLQKLNTVTA